MLPLILCRSLRACLLVTGNFKVKYTVFYLGFVLFLIIQISFDYLMVSLWFARPYRRFWDTKAKLLV